MYVPLLRRGPRGQRIQKARLHEAFKAYMSVLTLAAAELSSRSCLRLSTRHGWFSSADAPKVLVCSQGPLSRGFNRTVKTSPLRSGHHFLQPFQGPDRSTSSPSAGVSGASTGCFLRPRSLTWPAGRWTRRGLHGALVEGPARTRPSKAFTADRRSW